MSTRINTNTTAFMASINLDNNSNKLSGDIQQLSTGLRINSAADDPAGLVHAQDMNAQVVGLSQATSNTNDAVNEVKTAEGALNQVQTLLMSMRQLAVQASNLGANDTAEVQADQAQITSAIQSINQIAATTQFGTKFLLNGSASSAATTTPGTASVASGGTFAVASQAGSYGAANVNYAVALNAGTAGKVTTADTGAALATDLYSGSITIGGTVVSLTAGSNAASVQTQINTALGAGKFTFADNQTNTSITAVAGGAQANTDFSLSGLTRAAAAAPGTVIQTYGTGAYTDGTNSTVTLTGAPGGPVTSAASTTVNGATSFSFAGTALAGLNLTSSTAPSVAGGAAVNLGTLDATADSTTTGSNLQFQIGANAGQTVSIGIGSTASFNIGKGAKSYTDASGNSQTVNTANVSGIDVTTFKGAQDAMQVIDKAIDDVSTLRANLGAFQTNVLQSNANSLAVAQQNLSAAKSTIEDTDLASTITDYTKNQILVQSATSALSYANQMPQYALKLLQ